MPEGALEPWICLALDMTPAKRAETALRELSGRLLQLQDEERRRIARALHDTTAQNLAALSMNLTLLGDAAKSLAPRARQALDDSTRLTEQCLREVRTLSYLIHPPLLDELGLESALRAYMEGFERKTGIQVNLEILPKLGRLTREVETTVFRIVQESLTNVHRHSGSPSAAVRVSRDADKIVVNVSDRGRGLPPEKTADGGKTLEASGIGIAGLRERARHLGGILEIRSTGAGTTVHAALPSSQPPGS